MGARDFPGTRFHWRRAAAGIEAFEGQVDYEKLQCIAPLLGRANPVMERMRILRENTVQSVRVDSQKLDEHNLRSQVQKLSRELMIESSLNHRYEEIFQELSQKLGDMQISPNDDEREAAFEICGWLRKQIVEA